MKSKIVRSNPYTRLIRKMFLQMLAILMAAIIIVITLRYIGRGHMGNWILQAIQNYFNMDWYDAIHIYQFYVRNNIPSIVLVAIVLLFIVFFRFFLIWFTKYFNEIISGVDMLTQENGEKITFSSELNFMENKLNQVKYRLEERTRNSQEAEQRKNDLVVYLAHDIKTPLTSVIGYLNLLDEIPDMPSDQKMKYIKIALNKTYQLETLINEFFDITRYNLQNITLEREPIDLYYMLAQITDEFYPLLSPQGKKAVVHAKEDITVFGDPSKLARVFNNILKNALAYSDNNTTIEISAEALEDQVVIQFKNTGAQIPKDQLSSIFDKFYRIDEARSSATGGAGLGLAIAKEIVTLHGGTISAESEHSITVFTVTLPQRCLGQ